MANANILTKKVTLAETVKGGQIVSWSGHLATTGTAGKEPAAVALYDGAAGEIIAVTVIGLADVTHALTLTVGEGVKVDAGNIAKIAAGEKTFATVVELVSAKQAEILVK